LLLQFTPYPESIEISFPKTGFFPFRLCLDTSETQSGTERPAHMDHVLRQIEKTGLARTEYAKILLYSAAALHCRAGG